MLLLKIITMEWPIANPDNYEFIRNENPESIKKAIENQETKALVIIKKIDSQLTAYNIDLTIKRPDHTYKFIIWTNCLEIPLTIDKLEEVWDILVKILNDPLFLEWSLSERKIEKKSFMNHVYGIWKSIVDSNNSFLSKNDVEELFVFAQDVQNIHIDKWNIDNDVCANEEITRECKDALWNLKRSDRISWQLDDFKNLSPERKDNLTHMFIKWLNKKEQS